MSVPTRPDFTLSDLDLKSSQMLTIMGLGHPTQDFDGWDKWQHALQYFGFEVVLFNPPYEQQAASQFVWALATRQRAEQSKVAVLVPLTIVAGTEDGFPLMEHMPHTFELAKCSNVVIGLHNSREYGRVLKNRRGSQGQRIDQ